MRTGNNQQRWSLREYLLRYLSLLNDLQLVEFWENMPLAARQRRKLMSLV